MVNNTDPNLKNTDTFNDGETSIAINPRDPDDITISAFSGGWGARAPLWRSTDNGRTWTKLFTIPFPPGVAGTLGCPCDQTFDYGKNNALFGTFLTASPDNIYSGSTLDPTSATAWSWRTVASIAQPTNLAANSVGRADQPWLVFNRGTTKQHSERSEDADDSAHSAHSENVYVAYGDFGTSPVTVRASASINQEPPQFTSDQVVGSVAGAINPGHRLAPDPRNGWIYSLHQNCIANCATLTANPKTIQYILNRSTDQGATWTLNGSSTGVVIATADSTRPQPKFGAVNALLGGVDHAAVDPDTGDVYVVYGNRDAGGNNGLAIRRLFNDRRPHDRTRTLRGQRNSDGCAAVRRGHTRGVGCRGLLLHLQRHGLGLPAVHDLACSHHRSGSDVPSPPIGDLPVSCERQRHPPAARVRRLRADEGGRFVL